MQFGTRGILKMKNELHFEVLSEDRSGGIVIESLMKKILHEAGPVSIAIRPHRGKGKVLAEEEQLAPPPFSSGLLDLLPAKLAAYDKVFAQRKFVVVVVMDSDSDSPKSVYDTIHAMCGKFSPSLVHAIGISVEEIESWLLADERAILSAYPEANVCVIRDYRQDSICGTWEVLARAVLREKAPPLIRIGYPAVGQYKQEWANQIAPFLEPSRNVSPSFRSFRKEILRSAALFAGEGGPS